METGLNLQATRPSQRTASTFDVILLFAGANIVTTTLVTGGALAGYSFRQLAVLLTMGLLIGTLPLAWLARLGPRYGLPTMVLLRSVFGRWGAAFVSLLLILTNFAWIALNNVIAAGSLERLVGGPQKLWVLVVGSLALLIAYFGPKAMARFDRVAVPLLGFLGVLLTWKLLQIRPDAGASPPMSPSSPLPLLLGLDIIAGYQVSWSLMFADYTRFQKKERQASVSVLLGLSITSAWLMMVGARAAQINGSTTDPTEMILGLGLPAMALAILALSTVTTNFVNLFLSSLAVRSLWPRAPERGTLVMVGVIGTALGLVAPGILDQYANYMGLLGTLFLPLVGVTLVHFFGPGRQLVHQPEAAQTAAANWPWSAILCWLTGVLVYRLSQGSTIGATLPTLFASGALYALFRGLRWKREGEP